MFERFHSTTAERAAVVGAVMLLAIGAVACTSGGEVEPKANTQYSTVTAPITPVEDAPIGGFTQANILADLQNLPVKGRAPMTGYSRDQFGGDWDQHGGCDTRNDVLKRDLTAQNFDTKKCEVLSGVLQDPYTNTTINFVRGVKTSSEVQIDHVVAIGDAWQTGAQQLTPIVREQLYNDPLELLAVDGSANEQKGDGDAATWLPPNKNYRCTYVARQILVKQKYNLWVTQAEGAAMTRILDDCTGQSFIINQ